jgi:hypothetical protein
MRRSAWQTSRDEFELDEEVAAERQLLYVAPSHARDWLWISGVFDCPDEHRPLVSYITLDQGPDTQPRGSGGRSRPLQLLRGQGLSFLRS